MEVTLSLVFYLPEQHIWPKQDKLECALLKQQRLIDIAMDKRGQLPSFVL